MRITRRPTTGPTELGGALPVAETDTAERRPSASAGDRVELSDAARLRLRLRREIGDVDAVDSTRVAELQARIAAGTYAPSGRAIAERILREVAVDAVSGG